jgi:4-amino-4-deoxy-L-arabinose transferase-like glycosyltransferase
MHPSERSHSILVVLGLLVFCTILFQFGNGNVGLTDPDDVFYADTAKEMLSHHSWLTPIMFDKPQFEKPPLYYWLLMLSFQLLGVTAQAARLVGVVIGGASVLGTYFFARKLMNERVALLGAVVLASSIWWIGLSRVVLTDLLFSALIMASLYSFMAWYWGRRRSFWLTLFGIGTGLAMLAKSPLGLLLPLAVIVTFLLWQKDRAALWAFLRHPWWVLFALIGIPWYLYCTWQYGNEFVGEFLVHDHWDRLLHAEHGEFNHWYFYIAAVGFGFIPWTSFALFVRRAFTLFRPQALFLAIWIAVFALFFTAAQSKLTTYISPIYPALALLVAMGLAAGPITKSLRWWSSILLVILAIGLAAGAMVVASKYPAFATPALVAFGSLAVIVLVAGIVMFLNRVMLSASIAAAGIGLFALLAGGLVFGRLETGLTQTNLIPMVAQYQYSGKTILCSKLFVRGIFYYTENPVVVIAENRQPFWSSHPVPIVSTDAEVGDFAGSRDTLLAVLSHGDLERLVRNSEPNRHFDTLAADMGKTVLLSYSKSPSTGKGR